MMHLKYLDYGVNVVAVNEKKQAIFPWKKYQSVAITKAELKEQMSDPRAKGVAVICGAISGGLEVIDIDTKYETYDLWSAIKEKIPSEIYDRLHIVSTKSGGKHLYYKCEEIEGNQKLAQRPPTAEEAAANPHIKSYCIIETRGEAGYVVAPPSEGYTILKKGINVITSIERDTLFEIMRSFNEIIEEHIVEAFQRPTSKEYGVSPFDDYNKRADVGEVLLKHGWSVVKDNTERTYYLRPGSQADHSGSFNKDMRLFSVFSVNTPFIVQKGYKPAAVYAILEHNGDFKAAAKALLDLGYGEKKTSFGDKLERQLFSKKQNGATADDLVQFLVQTQKKTISDAVEVVGELEQRWGKEICTFWDIDKKGLPVVNRYKLQVFLTQIGGFRLYFYDPNSTIYRLVRIKDGFVEESSTEQIKRFIKEYVDKLPDSFDGGVTPQDLLELIYKGASVLFSDAFFEFFDRADIDFLQDSSEIAYYPFVNGVVEVKKGSIELKTYGELNKYVWRSQVIDHHIYIDQDKLEAERIEYYRFINLVSDKNLDRTNYGISLIGYLLHKYKDPGRPFSVILAEETENEASGGGTGKGIFVKALGFLNNLVRVDGKNFKVDKNFAFQRVDLDTKILAIEDTRRNVDFEGFYSIITEGITVEKKNKDELFIPFKDSPKVVFTTNYTIPNSGNHAKRRQKVFEFAPYFGPSHSPEDEFGHKFFDDWDADEWNRFFNFMFTCVQVYLEFGVLEIATSDKLGRKQIRVQYGEEFLDFILVAAEEHKNYPVKYEQLYNDFLSQSGFEKKDYSVKRFSKALEESCKILGIEYQGKRSKQFGNKLVISFGENKNELVDF
jgi:hypothetical protein